MSKRYPRDETGCLYEAHPPTVADEQFPREGSSQGESAKGVEVIGGHLNECRSRPENQVYAWGGDGSSPTNQRCAA